MLRVENSVYIPVIHEIVSLSHLVVTFEVLTVEFNGKLPTKISINLTSILKMVYL